MLAWEIDQVLPKMLFTVGGSAAKLVGALQRRRLIPTIPTQGITHYSARQSDTGAKARMADGIRAGVDRIRTSA